MSFESNVVAVSAMDRFTKLGKIKNKATIYDIVNANDTLTNIKSINGSASIPLPVVVEKANNDQGIFYGFVGTLGSLGCSGNDIELHKVSYRRRNNNTGDDNRAIDTWLRLLVWDDNSWKIVFQSSNSQKTGNSPFGGLTAPWEMVRVRNNIINSDTVIAFTIVTSIDAPANETSKFGARAILNTPSFISVVNNVPITTLNAPNSSQSYSYSPVFNIEYSVLSDKNLYDVFYSSRFYEVSALSAGAISDALTSIQSPHEGDYAVVNKYVTNDIIEKTAYTAIKGDDNIVWKALDGNYDAENVYFGSNLIATENIGTITIPSSGSTTVNVSGLNLKQALMKILAKEKYPTVTQPSVSLRFTNYPTVVEYGAVVSPTVAVSFNPGKYTYQTSTGVSFENADLTTTTETRRITSVGTYNLPDYCITTTNTTSSGPTYTASIVANYSSDETIKPLTNIGNDATVDIVDAEGTKVAAISADSTDATSSNQFSGFAAGRIYGYVTTLDNNVFSTDSDSVSANTAIITRDGSTVYKSANGTTAGKFTFTIKKNTKRIYIGAYGEGETRKLTRVYNKTVNADMTFTELGQNIPIYGASDKFTGKYRIWMFTHDNKFLNDAELEVTIG